MATFPAWWSGSPLRDPLSDPADFINASRAKLYLPVRLGVEREALRWIHGKKVAEKLSGPIEARFDAIIDDLRKFREDEFGFADEIAELGAPCQKVDLPYRCMAEWTELMPTDGTHVEVVQGITTAADDITKAELDTAQKLRAAQVDGEAETVNLKKKAVAQMSEPADIRVRVGDEEHDPPGGGARA